MSTTRTNYEYIGDGNSAGTIVVQSGEKLGFYGTAPITQQTAPAAVQSGTAVLAGSTGSLSTTVASLQSQALAAASLANSMRQDLIDIGLYTA